MFKRKKRSFRKRSSVNRKLFFIEEMKTALSLFLIIVCLPYLVTFVVQGDFLSEAGQSDEADGNAEADTEKLILILANEMPVTYEKEALKAQAVVARTNLAYARAHDLTEPEALEREEMQRILGTEEYYKRYDLLKSCVEETAFEVITYHGEVVSLPYHLVSAGNTREDPERAYLQSAASGADLQSERFLHISFMSKKQYLNKLKDAFPQYEFSEDTIADAAAVKKRDSAGYALSMEVAGNGVSGDEFASLLSLHSACFSIKEVDGQIRIVTKGYGHGYGMSQFGANQMALDGSSYQDILNHYYQDIEITDKK